MKMCGPLLLAILMTVVPPVKAQTLPNQPVSQLDLSRYLGKWHEIAHLPLFFQRQCQDRITATYSRLGHDQIQVLNTCRTKDGVIDAAEGVARPRREGGPGALEVRFSPGWLSWLPWVWADYWVVEIDPDYQWAVVGSPSRKYLWVLSRSPSMRQAQFDAIRERAAARGYPAAKLMVTAPLD